MVGVSEKIILDSEGIFREFKGSLAEQFACQELVAYNYDPAYWTSDSEAEIDFVIQGSGGEIVPIEIKSGTNLRAKSLKIYIEKYQPQIAIRSSQADYKKTNNLYDVPLYLLSSFASKKLSS